MPKRNLILLVFPVSFFLIVSFLLKAKPTYSLTNHVVISEVQITGTTATDEFVELYNPTGGDVNLTGWRLTRKTSGGTEGNLVASLSGTIKAHGYFLIAHPDYDGSLAEDAQYSAASNSVANDGTILVYSDAGVTLVDKVGIGASTDPEGSSASNPGAEASVERKAKSTSSASSMGIGGEDEFLGNAEDTNNNNNNFILKTTSEPQNFGSAIETPPSDFPVTPPITSPTLTPTDVPTPTLTPTSSPTPTIEPTPTQIPSPTPTVIPSPTPTLTPSPTPPPRVIGWFAFPKKFIVCTMNFRLARIGFLNVFFPYIVCSPLD